MTYRFGGMGEQEIRLSIAPKGQSNNAALKSIVIGAFEAQYYKLPENPTVDQYVAAGQKIRAYKDHWVTKCMESF